MKRTPTEKETDALYAASTLGDPATFAKLAQQFSQKYPESSIGWAALGFSYMTQGLLKESLEPLKTAARLLPADSEPLLNLGVALRRMGRVDEAKAAYRSALMRNPNCLKTLINLGGLLVDLGKHVEAEPLLKQALQLEPNSPEAMQNLAFALEGLGKSADAIATLVAAGRLAPTNVSILQRLASLLNATGRLVEASNVWKVALQLEPDNADILSEFGGAVVGRAKAEEVEKLLLRALSIRQDHVWALSHLGRLRYDQGRFADAAAAYQAACEADPTILAVALLKELLLPAILEDSEQISALRIARKAGLERLRTFDARDVFHLTNPLSFYLAYHGDDDRELIEAQAQVFKKVMPSVLYRSPNVTEWEDVFDRRMRVGFVSEYFSNHTISKLYAGYIQHLDRSRFEVIVFHAPNAGRDARRVELSSFADKVITLPPGLSFGQSAIAAEKLDILFYPDIGMSPITYFLAFARLAPVQVVSWGHPDTTGLDTLDYFLSAASVEPPDADAAYTEQLVRMQRLPCFYAQPELPEARLSRAELGLPEDGVIYGCPQSLYKIHPEFDQVLADIAAGDPEGHIVMIEGHPASMTNLLRKRWSRTAPILVDRVLWLPRLDFAAFISLLDHTDVLLDPIHFGSGNTLYEGMALGVPVVTWPGGFARGRIVAGAYRQMQISSAPVALTIEDYAPLALALGRDSERRAALRRTLKEVAAKELFSDIRAVRELEDFLTAAAASAARGEKLPADWQSALVR